MDDPSFLRLRLQYQSLVGSLNWLATNTRPDLAPVTSFLAAYNHHPTQKHMDAAVYAVKYLRQTTDYGIAFHSSTTDPASAYVHFPFHHDIEAYSDALPPSAAQHCEQVTPMPAGGVNLELLCPMEPKLKCSSYDPCQGL